MYLRNCVHRIQNKETELRNINITVKKVFKMLNTCSKKNNIQIYRRFPPKIVCHECLLKINTILEILIFYL